MLTLVAVRALQLWCRCSAELARNRRVRLVMRHLLLIDNRRRTSWLLCLRWHCPKRLLLLLLLLLRRNAACPAHVVDRHLVVGHRSGSVQCDTQRCGAARRHLRLSSRQCTRLGLTRRSWSPRRLCRLLLLLLMLQLLLLLRRSRPRLRTWAATSSSHTCKALLLLHGALRRLRSLPTCT